MGVALARRSECVPKKLGSSPMLAIHWQTSRVWVRFWHDPDPPSRLQSDRYRTVNGP
jgi:hypothetical protein